MAASLSRALARGGEPVIRKAMDLAMRLLWPPVRNRQDHRGSAGTCPAAGGARFSLLLRYARRGCAHRRRRRQLHGRLRARNRSCRHRQQRANHLRSRRNFGQAVRAASALQLHRMERVKGELYPRLRKLALLAIQQGIGFNIDAEEADRLEPSLDLFEMLANDSALGRWQGLGFVSSGVSKARTFCDRLPHRSCRTH